MLRRGNGRARAACVLVLAAVPAVIAAGPEPSAARNLLVLTFDTTRADHLSVYGGPAKVPHLEGLAREGVRFDHAFAPTPITLPSHVSLFTGLYPAAHGVRNNGTQRLGDEARTLAELLQERGFRTAAVIGSRVLDSRYGLDQGFDLYDDRLPPEERVDTLFAERRAAEVAERGIAWLRERTDERWFLWLHFFDPHWEYRPPEPFRSRYADSPYDGEIAYTDEQAGRVLGFVRERGWLDDTLVVATADHGESLGEHGESSHGIFLYDATMRIPLLMRHPGRLGRGQTVGQMVSLVDVMPTVLAVLDVPAGGTPFHGRPFSPGSGEGEEPGRLVWMESWMPRLSYGWSELLAVRDRRWKYIRAPRVELYDLAADPGERRDLVAAEEDRAAGYRRRLEEMEALISAAQTPARNREPAPSERRALESLGYVSARRVVPTGADPKDKIVEYESVQRALELVSRERYAEAIPGLGELVRRNPRSTFLCQHLGNALRHAGRPDDGIRQLGRCAELDPEDFGTFLDLGSAFLTAGDLGAAEERLRRALELNPHLAQAWHNLGLVAARRERVEEAVRMYERALEEDPNLLRSLVNLGRLYETAGRTDEAIRLYLQVADLDPGNGRAFFSAGYLLFKGGRHQEALVVLDRAAHVDPDSPLPYLYRAQVYLALDDLDAAEREFREALARDPGSEDARRGLTAIQRRRTRDRSGL